MPIEPARLSFTDEGIPFSAAYGDVYHSAHGGIAQARHVFLAGNDLPARWQNKPRFVILETGFGLGLNFLTTWHTWRADPLRAERLHFVSFEKHPFSRADLVLAQQGLNDFPDLAAELQAQWPSLTAGIHRLRFDEGRVTLTLIFGDATQALRTVDLAADAFFLDGFSPAKNPELWTAEICQAIARLAARDATLATWSVAGKVREALQAAQFTLEKRPGFAGKRQMLTGRYQARKPDRHPVPNDKRAIIIGAGVAGCTAAHRLAAEGWEVTLIEAQAAPATAASGNLAGVLRPLPSADDNRLSRLTRAGYLATRQLLHTLPDAHWSACGVMHLARDEAHAEQQKKAVDKLEWPASMLQWRTTEQVTEALSFPAPTSGWFFPEGGWVQPGSICRAALAAYPERIRLIAGVTVDALKQTKTDQGTLWHAFTNDGALVSCAPIAIIAMGAQAPQLAVMERIPQIAARGQVTHLPANSLPSVPHVVCRFGYTMPTMGEQILTGATLQARDTDPSLRAADHQENLGRLARSLPALANQVSQIPLANCQGKTGFRPMSPDRLPMVGPVPVMWSADAPITPSDTPWHRIPRQDGLWCVQGFGARGIVWSALMADLLVSRLQGDPLPLENDLVAALDPARFVVRPPKFEAEEEGA